MIFALECGKYSGGCEKQWLNCVRRVSGEFREKVCQKGSGSCGRLPDPLHGCVWEMSSMRQERCRMSTGKSVKELRRLVRVGASS